MSQRKTNPKPRTPPEPKIWEGKKCGECGNVTEVTRFHTLTIKDRKPTLGKCPFYKDGVFCVLLSSPACKEHFTPKTDGNAKGNQSEG